MKSLLAIVRMFMGISPAVIAAFLAYHDKEGWGWFLLVGGLYAFASCILGIFMLGMQDKIKEKVKEEKEKAKCATKKQPTPMCRGSNPRLILNQAKYGVKKTEAGSTLLFQRIADPL